MSESVEKRKFGDEEIDVIYKKARPAGVGENKDTYPPPLPSTTVMDGMRIERDVSLPLRDGTMIYTDIFRPEGATNVPSIISWTPYGKRNYVSTPPWQAMLKDGTCTLMAKFECAEPTYWCKQGYAVINPDPRGVAFSQGDIPCFGTQEGRDGYDLIEWVASREWSNGKTALFGNSWAAMAQWYIAAEKPPHLTCMAPWEGISDIYREAVCWGGMRETSFWTWIVNWVGVGPNRVEDFVAMAKKYPLMNGYWEDKVPKFENVEIPAYLTAGWCHFHLRGSTEAFQRISSPSKWLRVHRDFEWYDDFQPENIADLQRFFDRYLKGIHNGWEMTPKVRIDVMDSGDMDYQHWRPEKEFPLARTRYEKLYLDAKTGQLSKTAPTTESSVRYEAPAGRVNFVMPFDEETELTGYMKLRLCVEADGSNDMDLFVTVQKLDEKGEQMPVRFHAGDPVTYPHPGFPGKLRVSLRELDEKMSKPYKPYYPYRHEQLLKPNEIVPVDIEVWPTSMIWHPGQQLRVVVSGNYFREPGWFETFTWDLRNKGNHIIHTGGKYDSHLLVPVIPPKVTARGYSYR